MSMGEYKMAMTITEKILAYHAGLDSVKTGELIKAKLDFALGNDITAPVAINEFEKAGFTEVFHKDKIGLLPDHFTPNKDIKSAEQVKMVREFSKKHNLKHFYEAGRVGVEHAFLPEQGIVVAGDLVIGADSHTCTYGALGAFSTGVGSTDLAYGLATGLSWFRVPEQILFVINGKLPKYSSGKDIILYIIGKIGVDGARYSTMEFVGDTIDELSIEGRLTIANMAIEAGGKNGIFAVDQKTIDYMKPRAQHEWQVFTSDTDAHYHKVIEIDATKIEPQIALPHIPENTKPVSECENIKIDQIVIGSCTNGRIEDLRVAADIMKGKQCHNDIRCIVIPATQEIYKMAMNEGLMDTFIDAGCVVSTPTCGPCLGGYMGILAEGERALSTTNRNFVGRMGHVKSEVYLCSPAIAAASSIKGTISHPDNV